MVDLSRQPAGRNMVPPVIPGLSIDDEGRFLVHGEPVHHERTLEVLWRGLEPAEGGGWIVRVGRESAPVAVDGTPYVVLGIAHGPGSIALRIAGGSQEPLVPETLRVGRDGLLRATLASGHPARFSRAAQIALGMLLSEDSTAPGGFRLSLLGKSWPLGAE
jgi:hypothetical protein